MEDGGTTREGRRQTSKPVEKQRGTPRQNFPSTPVERDTSSLAKNAITSPAKSLTTSPGSQQKRPAPQDRPISIALCRRLSLLASHRLQDVRQATSSPWPTGEPIPDGVRERGERAPPPDDPEIVCPLATMFARAARMFSECLSAFCEEVTASAVIPLSLASWACAQEREQLVAHPGGWTSERFPDTLSEVGPGTRAQSLAGPKERYW